MIWSWESGSSFVNSGIGYFSEPSSPRASVGNKRLNIQVGLLVCAAGASYTVFLWFLCLSMLLNSSNAGTCEWRSLDQIPNSATSRPLLSPSTLSSMKHYGVAASGLARRVRQGDRMCWLTVTEAELMGKREGQLQ